MEQQRTRKYREEVKCGHCGKQLQLDNLELHTVKKHRGLPVRRENDPKPITNFFKAKDSSMDKTVHKAPAASSIKRLQQRSNSREREIEKKRTEREIQKKRTEREIQNKRTEREIEKKLVEEQKVDKNPNTTTAKPIEKLQRNQSSAKLNTKEKETSESSKGTLEIQGSMQEKTINPKDQPFPAFDQGAYLHLQTLQNDQLLDDSLDVRLRRVMRKTPPLSTEYTSSGPSPSGPWSITQKVQEQADSGDLGLQEICADEHFHPQSSPLSNQGIETVHEPMKRRFSQTESPLSPSETLEVLQRIRQQETPEDLTRTISPVSNHLLLYEKTCSNAIPRLYDPSCMRRCMNFEKVMWKGFKGDYAPVVVRSDGNCLYSSFSLCLFGTQEYGPEIRLMEVNHLLMERDSLKGICGVLNETFDTLLKQTKTHVIIPKEKEGWGREANIFVASEIFNRPIIVHQAGPSEDCKGCTMKYNSNPQNNSRIPIHLMLYQSHFQPLLPLNHGSRPIEVPSSNVAFMNIEHKYKRLSLDQPDVSDAVLRQIQEVQRPLYKQMESVIAIDKAIARNLGQPVASLEKHLLNTSCVEVSDVEMKSQGSSDSDIVVTSEISNQSEESSSSSSGPDTIGKLNSKMNELTAMMSELLQKQGGDPVKTLAVVKISKTFDKIASVDDLLTHYNCFTTNYRHEDALERDTFTEILCNTCYDPLDQSKCGHFSYHSSSGTDFSGGLLSDNFRNLKYRLKKHLESKTHIQLAGEKCEGNNLERKYLEKNYQAGIVLSRLAYTAIKLDRDMARYEDYVAINAANNVPVGDINHSRKFCREFSHSAYECLHEKYTYQLAAELPSTGRPTPFAIISDKYTPNRLTGQIVGIVSYTNGTIQDSFVDFAKVFDHTAKGIADSLAGSLRNVHSEDNLCARLVGGCMDGEYIKKNIPQKLMTSLQINNDHTDWYSWDWDKPHIIELACDEANKQQFFKQIDSTMKNINKKFAYGKAYGDILMAVDDKLKAPIQASETRFAAYHYRVLNNFISNYTHFYGYLNETTDPDLHKIDHCSFVLGLTCKADIMKVVSEISLQCQKVGLNSWRMYDIINDGMSDLDLMVESLGKDRIHHKLSTFQAAMNEVKETSTFKGKPVLSARQQLTSSRSKDTQFESNCTDIEAAVHHTKAQAQQFVSTFVTGFKKRADDNVPKVYNMAEKSFKLENVLQYVASEEVPEELIQYFNLAKNVGYLPSELEQIEIKNQYRTFSVIVASEVSRELKCNPNCMSENPAAVETRIYDKLCSVSTKQNMKDVVDLLLSVRVRTHCEAACESMGSIIKSIADTRTLDHRNIREEAFIIWNGPSPYNRNVEKLLSDSLDRHFKGRDKWHFYRKTQNRGLLKYFTTSEVVDRKVKESESDTRIVYK